ncbi:MAG: alpha/beta hydrolase [Polyangiales bacterium]
MLDRRQAIALAIFGAAAFTGGVAIGRRPRRRLLGAPTSKDPRGDLDVREWTFATPDGERRVVVIVPRPLAPDAKLPLLIALHGRGEADSPRVGAHAWLDTYGLDVAYRTLRTPPIDRAHTAGLARPARLAELDATLGRDPFDGLVVACPSIDPDIGGRGYDRYARFLGEQLLPRLRAETPIIGTARTTGIDGVSLGGISALRVGAARPDLFHAVGGIQPAIMESPSEGHVVDVLARELRGRPLRLLTTDDDAYRDQVVWTSKTLAARGVAHELVVTGGLHDAAFLRAVGALELLYFHDRVLRN